MTYTDRSGITLPGDTYFDTWTQQYVVIVAGAQSGDMVTVQFPDTTVTTVRRKNLYRASRLARNEPIHYPEK